MKRNYNEPIVEIIDIIECDVLTASTLGNRLPGDEDVNIDDL